MRPVWRDEPEAEPREAMSLWEHVETVDFLLSQGLINDAEAKDIIERTPFGDVERAKLATWKAQLAAQQAGASTDPDKLGRAEASVPFWVASGERP